MSMRIQGARVQIFATMFARVLSACSFLCAMQGKVCNMAKPGDVASFANYARDTLGTVDLW